MTEYFLVDRMEENNFYIPNCRTIRLDLGLSQDGIDGVGRASVSKMETGKFVSEKIARNAFNFFKRNKPNLIFKETVFCMKVKVNPYHGDYNHMLKLLRKGSGEFLPIEEVE